MILHGVICFLFVCCSLCASESISFKCLSNQYSQQKPIATPKKCHFAWSISRTPLKAKFSELLQQWVKLNDKQVKNNDNPAPTTFVDKSLVLLEQQVESREQKQIKETIVKPVLSLDSGMTETGNVRKVYAKKVEVSESEYRQIPKSKDSWRDYNKNCVTSLQCDDKVDQILQQAYALGLSKKELSIILYEAAVEGLQITCPIGTDKGAMYSTCVDIVNEFVGHFLQNFYTYDGNGALNKSEVNCSHMDCELIKRFYKELERWEQSSIEYVGLDGMWSTSKDVLDEFGWLDNYQFHDAVQKVYEACKEKFNKKSLHFGDFYKVCKENLNAKDLHEACLKLKRPMFNSLIIENENPVENISCNCPKGTEEHLCDEFINYTKKLISYLSQFEVAHSSENSRPFSLSPEVIAKHHLRNLPELYQLSFVGPVKKACLNVYHAAQGKPDTELVIKRSNGSVTIFHKSCPKIRYEIDEESFDKATEKIDESKIDLNDHLKANMRNLFFDYLKGDSNVMERYFDLMTTFSPNICGTFLRLFGLPLFNNSFSTEVLLQITKGQEPVVKLLGKFQDSNSNPVSSFVLLPKEDSSKKSEFSIIDPKSKKSDFSIIGDPSKEEEKESK